MQKQKSNKRNKKQNQNQKQMLIHLSHPPTLRDHEVRWTTRLRFVASNTVNLLITARNIMDSVFLGTGAATGYQAFASAKIKFVEIWSINQSSVAPQTVSVLFNSISGPVGNQAFSSDTSLGVEPAHVKAKPSKQSLAAFYFPSTAANVFDITCPTSSVVDIGVSFISTGSYSVAIQAAPAATVAGNWYCGGLDGLRAAGTSLNSVGAYPPL